ncbi:MAG TPA: response regulator [Ruminiclostridium sp.]|nr:response regulator [Ruminiclostridium sp.]
MSNKIKSILLIDDNRAFTEVFYDYFNTYKDSGFTIVGIANNGFKAVEMIRALQPDIVLLDISMPHFSGYNVLETVATMELKKKPKVIMLTGMRMHDAIQASMELGAVGFIEKPFEMEKVISVLSRI